MQVIDFIGGARGSRTPDLLNAIYGVLVLYMDLDTFGPIFDITEHQGIRHSRLKVSKKIHPFSGLKPGITISEEGA